MKKPFAQEGGRTPGQYLQIHEARIHRFKDTDPEPEDSSSHVLSFFYVKVANNLTTDCSEVRNDGEVEASSAIMKAKNMEPDMFREGKAMAEHRSFSYARN